MAASQPTPDKTKAELKVDIPSKTELLKLANKGKEDVDEPLTPEQNFIGDEAGGSKTSDLTEREQLAVTQGWQSEDDWVASGKDIKQWRPADQWLDRGDFFRTISGLKQEVIKSQQLVSAAFEQGRKLESAKLEKERA